jgi:RHS repeat-associated protein
VLEEYAPGGALAATYVRGLDLLFQDRSGTRSYYVTDGLESTRALANSTGTVTDTYTLDAFGNVLGRSGTTLNEYLFAGYQFDAALGHDYLRARYLDSTAGRFVSRDSLEGQPGDPSLVNHYLYASADPVNRIDPSGHSDLGELLVTVSIGVGIPVGLGGASAAVYSKILGADAGKGFIVGLQLGAAFDIAYFSGGAGLSGIKKVGEVVTTAFWTGVLKLAGKYAQYSLQGQTYPPAKQAQDFYEAFASSAFYASFGDLIGNSDIGDDPARELAYTFLASASANFLAEVPEIFSGKQGFLDGVTNALQNTEVSFLQSNLLNEAFTGFPGLARAAMKSSSPQGFKLARTRS